MRWFCLRFNKEKGFFSDSSWCFSGIYVAAALASVTRLAGLWYELTPTSDQKPGSPWDLSCKTASLQSQELLKRPVRAVFYQKNNDRGPG